VVGGNLAVVTTSARRAAVGATLATVTAAAVFSGGPASADVINGWSNPSDVNPLHFLALILFIPLGLAIVISALVLLPGVLRGEGLIPTRSHSSDVEEQQRGH
jgi:hypothetical protein